VSDANGHRTVYVPFASSSIQKCVECEWGEMEVDTPRFKILPCLPGTDDDRRAALYAHVVNPVKGCDCSSCYRAKQR
jgi:hypothetical protein